MIMVRSTLAVLIAIFWPVAASAQLSVLHSGGFAVPYRALLPAFEKSSGLTVASTQAASQGNGSNTIPALLRRGTTADVVIMSKEGLNELLSEGRIVAGSAVDLAQSPLGVAVRAGIPKPDISSVEGFKQAVLRAKSINFVSTTAIYMNETLFPMLGIADEVARKANGDSLANLPHGQVDLVLRPVSEIINLTGFDYVGPVPREIQFVSVFTAAVVAGTRQADAARRLIAFLSSEEASAVARKNGMDLIERR